MSSCSGGAPFARLALSGLRGFALATGEVLLRSFMHRWCILLMTLTPSP